ncbi:MAG: precorrin-8X methylmutase [Candidatus Hydrothermarchaeota archaeon]|nr:precorrin-8X methylmutase [Candidatus Hydrothermarchaeota archaeon]
MVHINRKKTAIIIVGHGSRVKQSRGIYEEVARKVREKSGIEAQVGYMKHWNPTIAETINAVVEKGIKKIVIVPLFLLPGLHVTEDIPVLLGLKEGELPEFGYEKIRIPSDVEILYARHIGADDRLADVVLDRVKEVLKGSRHDSQFRQEAGMHAIFLAEEHFETLRPLSSGMVHVSRAETQVGQDTTLVRCRARSGATKPDKRSGLKIEEQSFKIIEKKLGSFPVLEREVIKRAIHATADFELAELIVFNRDAVERGVEALKSGKNVITDVNMVKAGINSKALKKYGSEVKCFISEEEVYSLSESSGKTRASSAFRLFKHELQGSIAAIGNAPTALFELCKLIEEGIKPSLVVAVPVGFVGAKEAKEKILGYALPSIVVRGNKGGSTVAAAVVNALIKLADKHA